LLKIDFEEEKMADFNKLTIELDDNYDDFSAAPALGRSQYVVSIGITLIAILLMTWIFAGFILAILTKVREMIML